MAWLKVSTSFGLETRNLVDPEVGLVLGIVEQVHHINNELGDLKAPYSFLIVLENVVLLNVRSVANLFSSRPHPPVSVLVCHIRCHRGIERVLLWPPLLSYRVKLLDGRLHALLTRVLEMLC